MQKFEKLFNQKIDIKKIKPTVVSYSYPSNDAEIRLIKISNAFLPIETEKVCAYRYGKIRNL